MGPRRHRVSPEAFAALSSGAGGRDALRELTSAEHSKHMILLASVPRAARGTEQYQHARTGYDLLAEAWRTNQAATEKVIRYPSVGVWARQAIQTCRGDSEFSAAEPAAMCAVGAAAAVHAGLTAEIEVPVRDGRISLPSLGAALVADRTAVIRTAGGRATVGSFDIPEDPYQRTQGWLGLHRVHAGPFDVLIDDQDPFRMPDLPDLSSQVTAEAWDASLRSGWHVLESHHPVVAAEVAEAVSVIVPRSAPQAGVVSTTSPEEFGAVGMSLPPDPVTCAETLTHEVQHLKLGALQNMIALTMPDDGRRYYAPWRDDPRPLNGLLQGTYAYLGVTGFWRRQRGIPSGHRKADYEYARWRAAASQSTEVLRSSGGLTQAGLDFVSGIARTLAAWENESVAADAEADAGRANESHLTRWQSANGRSPAP